jgi:hypothetical protein
MLAKMVSVQKQRSFLEGFLKQERTPLYTVVSFLMTVIVWAAITLDCLTGPRDWGGLAQAFLLVLALVIGTLINIVLGAIAFSRGEYCGGRLSAIGIALWFVTVAVFRLTRVGLFGP